MLRTTPTQISEHGEAKLVPTWSLYTYLLASLVHYLFADISLLVVYYNGLLPARHTSAMVTQSFVVDAVSVIVRKGVLAVESQRIP